LRTSLQGPEIIAADGSRPPHSSEFLVKLSQSLRAVRSWVEAHNFKGYDPADGNASILHPLTFGNVFLQRVLQQVVLRSPWNIRPLLGVPALESAPARGYMAAGYLALYRHSKSVEDRERAIECLDWLTNNKSPGYSDFAWGNQFNYATRTGKRPRLEPIIVWSALNGQAFVDAYEILDEEKYLEVARSVCRWITQLQREKTESGSCLSYVAYKQVSIHNSNMLGAALLARVGTIDHNSEFLDLARDAMRYSSTRIQPDGSWLYGEHPKYHWIDNFHTGYNIDCLKQYIDTTGESEFQKVLEQGLAYFKAHFFEADGCPKYFHNAKYPIDIQSSAQAIETLVHVSDIDPESLPLARRVADWTITNMQAPDGHFYYRDLGWTKVTTPMIHWGQATMFKALVELHHTLLREDNSSRE
jgi:rhamnogalacturonyl hydrolase YesR